MHPSRAVDDLRFLIQDTTAKDSSQISRALSLSEGAVPIFRDAEDRDPR